MKKVLLDTNFILTCIRNKVDFFEEIQLLGITIIIPEQVIKEIERISTSQKKLRFREEAKIALNMLKKSPFKKISLENKNVDNGIAKLAKKDKSIIIATLDKELQGKFPNQKLIIRQKKKLEVI